MPNEFVNWRQEDDIAVIIIDNPPVNAFSLKVASELLKCLEEINDVKSCRSLVITGAGEKAFVAGADIRELEEIISSSASTLPYTERLHTTLNYLEEMPMPTIAAINGFALGGGLELALACDIRIASEKAMLGMPEIKLGIFPGAGGTQRLPRLIGIALAKELIFTGEPITAADALKIALVNRVVLPGKELDAARELAHLIASRSKEALRLVKEVINRGIKVTLEEGCMMEREFLEKAFLTSDAREGIKAFLEKREARFK